MTVCVECGGPVDPDVAHTACDGTCGDYWCCCPEVCASCCKHPDCPTRQIPGQLTIDEAT